MLPRNLIGFSKLWNVGVLLINNIKTIVKLAILFLDFILLSFVLYHFDYLHLFFLISQKAYRKTFLVQRQIFPICEGRYFMGSSLTYHVSWSLSIAKRDCLLLLLRSIRLKSQLFHILVCVTNTILSPLMGSFTRTFNPLQSIWVRRKLLERLKFITSEVGCT